MCVCVCVCVCVISSSYIAYMYTYACIHTHWYAFFQCCRTDIIVALGNLLHIDQTIVIITLKVSGYVYTL